VTVTERTFAELEQVLADEREAIRHLDGGRVLELAQRKQTLVTDLCRARESLSSESTKRLQSMMPQRMG